jgi:Xaa-Pro aminopeptidase
MIDSEVFRARRDAYLARLGPNACAVVSSLPERLRNGDSDHVFRQSSDVVYLTGFEEPECTLVLRPGTDQPVIMFVRPRDPDMETWHGRRAGLEGAKQHFGAHEAFDCAQLEAQLWQLIANFEEVHYAVGIDDHMDQVVTRAIARLRRSEKKGKRPPLAIIDPRVALHELRLHKQPEELAMLRTACDIASQAHQEAMKLGRPGVFEYELEAIINYTFRKNGGAGPGYNTIVGSGDNATILHYIENNRAIAEGDLVLVDAGCEYQHYTSDITRTFPASGRFSQPQRRVYERVLAVQKSAIAMVRPGVTLDAIHDHCIRGLTEAMIELGLLSGSVDERVADGSFRAYYMHGTSHWLGMDVHDAGAYTRGGSARPLEPGMVITVEPGLYIAASADSAPAELRGIGVRIEDDVAVTVDGCEVLTASCPKEIADLERICSTSAAPRLAM